MGTPRYCPYCFDRIERTRYWYRDAPEIDLPDVTPEDAQYPGSETPVQEVDEMVMVKPCGHSFEAGRWFDYADACTMYSLTLAELKQMISSDGARFLSEELEQHDMRMRISAEECCETMERTPPEGVFSDA
ncbi:hypothetical protein HUG10_20940 (plasmid) [Halorarum halophilum]|uniref:Uncharacterized protein n=1 Tax=Halorarum halophilum TaxID=2743090 RepID=A0A7D5KAP6_9EURY|nr:hypothetical protein [Halobaculum halophilum]QLG30054.1 hypothetical protein HUG10_20940 [Halobaculum halophilum]